jgi:cell fate (sporulation/competence/biofilm development) regulator YlbF (YheA/YmcA/DUF963 family)
VYWEHQSANGRDAGVEELESRLIMEITFEDTAVLQKTKELCQTILEEPNMRSIRQRIDAFMGDEKTRAQYDGLVTKGQELQQKQQNSLPLSGEEISDFEQHRGALLSNSVAKGFLDAQEELHNVQHTIQQYVSKTLELGRMPTEEDVNGGCCSDHNHGGCGCSH